MIKPCDSRSLRALLGIHEDAKIIYSEICSWWASGGDIADRYAPPGRLWSSLVENAMQLQLPPIGSVPPGEPPGPGGQPIRRNLAAVVCLNQAGTSHSRRGNDGTVLACSAWGHVDTGLNFLLRLFHPINDVPCRRLHGRVYVAHVKYSEQDECIGRHVTLK